MAVILSILVLSLLLRLLEAQLASKLVRHFVPHMRTQEWNIVMSAVSIPPYDCLPSTSYGTQIAVTLCWEDPHP